MNGTYVGRLSADDPLHGFLTRVARDRMGVRGHDDSYRVFRLSGSHEVYCYEGRSTSTRVIGKFFGPRFGWDRDRAAGMASREYESLQRLRGTACEARRTTSSGRWPWTATSTACC